MWFRVILFLAILLVVMNFAYAQECNELVPGHNKDNLNQINILFLGIGYQNEENLLGLVREVVDLDSNSRGFFSKEPFKSNKELFNLWYVVSKEIGEGRNATQAIKEILVSQCTLIRNLSNLYILTYSNREPFLAMPRAAADFGKGATILWTEADFSTKTISDQKFLFLHEFGAHGFGEMPDEYILPSNLSYEERKIASAAVNCFVGSYEACLVASPWSDIVGRGCGDPLTLDCSEDAPEAYKEVGCYEGCRLFGNGAFRPHKRSILNEQDKEFFGLVHERELCRKIHNLTLNARGYCYEQFGIGAPEIEEKPKINLIIIFLILAILAIVLIMLRRKRKTS